MSYQHYRLEELARLVQGELVGQADLGLQGLASLELAEPQHIAFVNADKYVEQAKVSKAGALIVTPELQQQLDTHQNFIVVANPYLAFAILTHVFERKHTQTGIESTAKIHPSAIISESAYIGHYVVVGENCVVNPLSSHTAKLMILLKLVKNVLLIRMSPLLVKPKLLTGSAFMPIP